MFDQIVETIAAYPYVGVAMVFFLCGLGFPLPEEVVLLAAGYICAEYPDRASLLPMMLWCAGAIMVGDLLPFTLGRVFGVRLLRLRWLRYVVTKQRLAMFDRWFRRRGDLVIVISRFLAGLRVVAFFTAGAMKMGWLRFLLLDGLGIALMVPLLSWLGFRSAGFIKEMIETVQTVERGLLWAVVAGATLLAVWFWLWRRRRQRARQRRLEEAFVQPEQPVQSPLPELPTTGTATTGTAAADADQAADADAPPAAERRGPTPAPGPTGPDPTRPEPTGDRPKAPKPDEQPAHDPEQDT